MNRRDLVALVFLCAACAAPVVSTPSVVPTPAPTPYEPPLSAYDGTPTPHTPGPYVCRLEFCYRRLQIDVPLVLVTVPTSIDTSYTGDPSGSNVVRYTNPQVLTRTPGAIVIAGHSDRTPMYAITGWQAGDDVQIDGAHFTVFGAITVLACVPMTAWPPPARLYMMTSINTESCASGLHQNIVVMAR